METGQSKNRLLLVDGDPKSLRVLDVSLKKAGFEVSTATSGREAITLLEAGQPDLIISDTDLDEIDGFELCSRIKARPEWAKIPFLFVSGRKSIEDKIRGLELGVDDYLTKPIYIKEIGIRVRTALQRAERERMESRREGRTRFAGDLSDVGVVDLLQTIEVNRKSGIIHIVNRDGRRGSIFFREGKVIDGEVGRLSGVNAIYRLFSWSEGQFAVEFKQIRRHDVIDTPMAPLLMEGMRRLDESARLLEQLPTTSSVLEVDYRALAEELAELPDEVNSVLRLCDGTRTLLEVVEDSDRPDLEAFGVISKLFAGKVIFAREAPVRGGKSEPGEHLASWLSEGGAENGATGDEASVPLEVTPTQILTTDLAPAPVKALPPDAEAPVEPRTAQLFSVEDLAQISQADPEAKELVSGTAAPGVPTAPRGQELSAEESLGAVLPPRPDSAGEGSNEFVRSAGTLKGVPLESFFAEQEAQGEALPPPAATTEAAPDTAVVRAPMETRSTKPLGLAERLLSDDSVVRASAMHEAIDDDNGTVVGAQPSDRNTREYGDPAAEAAVALVHEVVSSAHEIKKDAAPLVQPERPTKEVDWGAWATGAQSTSPNAVQPPPSPGEASKAVPQAEKAAASDGTAVLPQAVRQEALPAEPSEPPPVPAVALGEEQKDVPPGAAESIGVSSVARDSGNSEASKRSASTDVSSATKDSQSEPSAKPGDPQVTRKPGTVGPIWFLAPAALVVGMVGYLVLVGRAPAPGEPHSSASQGAVEPQPNIQPTAGLVPAPEKLAPTVASSTAATVQPAKSQELPAHPGLEPKSTDATELRRKCLEADAEGKGKAKAVSAACRPAVDADPMDAEIMVILARAEIDRGRLAEARNLAKKAFATDPQRFDAYVLLGAAEQEAGRIDEARAAYKKYLELAPDGTFARELRAVLNNL